MRSTTGIIASVTVWTAFATTVAAGPVVNVTVSSTEDVLGIGQTRTFSVLASVADPAGSLDGIFSYDINVNFSVPGVVGIVPGSTIQPDADVLSPGVISSTGLSACYGVHFYPQSSGINSPRELVRFSLDGMATGSAAVGVCPDATIGDDFVLQMSTPVPSSSGR